MINKYKTDVLKLNIQEQVQYLTDLHETNKGLVSWGIRVIDRVNTVEELNNIDVTTLEYGDAVAVGTESPFFFYIWTRASIGTDTAYWFPFGEITTPGPEGPPGESIVGETGPRGSKWFTGLSQPILNDEIKDGDMFLDQQGNVTQAFTYSNGTRTWLYVTNIKGAPGVGNPGPAPIISNDGQYITSTNPQTGATTNVVALELLKGNPGERGPASGFINIRGILPQGPLPTPESLNDLTAAYLVGAAAPYTLWVQVGENIETAEWRDVGPFNAATAVSVNSVYQSLWDADTKLDKITYTGNYDQVYIKYYNGTQGMGNISPGTSIPRSIVQRTDDGDVIVPDVPVSSNGATSKSYVDNTFVPKYTNTGSLNRAYMAKAGSAGDGTVEISQSADSNTLVQRTSNGNIKASAPVENNDLTTKQYVDENFTPKTQAATESNLGLVKSAKSYGFVVTSVGAPSADTLSLSEYTNASAAAFIGKGTLQNIIGLVEGTIIVDGESFIKRVPAYLKNEPEAYIGACCLADEVRHVLMGYDYDNDEFVVYDMSDETSTMMGDYTIEQ